MRRPQDGGQNGRKGHTEQSVLSRTLDYFPGFGLVLATFQFQIKKKKIKAKAQILLFFFFYFQVDFVYIVWGGRLKCNRVQRSHDIPPPPRTHDLPHCHYPQQNGMFVTISELH